MLYITGIQLNSDQKAHWLSNASSWLTDFNWGCALSCPTQLIDHKQGGDNGVYFLVKVNLSGSTFDKLQGYIIVKYGHI